MQELEDVGRADKDVVDEDEVGRQRRVALLGLGRQARAVKQRRIRRRVVVDGLDRDVAVHGELLDPVDPPPVGLVRVGPDRVGDAGRRQRGRKVREQLGRAVVAAVLEDGDVHVARAQQAGERQQRRRQVRDDVARVVEVEREVETLRLGHVGRRLRRREQVRVARLEQRRLVGAERLEGRAADARLLRKRGGGGGGVKARSVSSRHHGKGACRQFGQDAPGAQPF